MARALARLRVEGSVLDGVELARIRIVIAAGRLVREDLVRIRESAEPGWVVLDVVDEGPGIPTEHRSRLYEPFFTTKPRGTGLGLAISHRIVTAHAGTIEARAGSPVGTIFRIRLPLSVAERSGVTSSGHGADHG